METSRVYKAWLRSLATENTRKAYDMAMLDLVRQCGRSIGDLHLIDREEADRWVSYMKERYAKPTVSLRISAAVAFYRYGIQTYSNIIVSNPFDAVRRPKINPFGKANYLSVEEAKALLSKIDRRKLQGKRDYALYFGYIITGRRNSEWRKKRWGDFQIKGDKVYYRWSGKGKNDMFSELPTPLWTAILDMLKADGRAETIGREDYIFVAYGTGTTTAIKQRISGSAPLQSKAVSQLLKTYCKRAGLEPSLVKVHTLRHTAAMLRKEAGDDIEKISHFLGHSSISTTQIYLHAVEGRGDNSWMTVSALLGV